MEIDKSFLLDLFGEDLGAADQLLSMMFDSAQTQIAKLREAVRDADREKLSAAAHQLSGSTITCGLVEISQRFRAMEQDAHSASLTCLSDRIQSIEARLKQAEIESHALFRGGIV